MPPRFLHSRGVPAPSNWRRIRLRLKAPTWINCRFRSLASRPIPEPDLLFGLSSGLKVLVGKAL